MKSAFTVLFLLLSTTSFAQFTRDREPVTPQFAANRTDSLRKELIFFVCDSRGTKAYHKSELCEDLLRCNHQVKEVTQKEAEEKYRRAKCQICW